MEYTQNYYDIILMGGFLVTAIVYLVLKSDEWSKW